MRYRPLAAALAVAFGSPLAIAADPVSLTEVLVTASRPASAPLAGGVVPSAVLKSLPAATSDSASLLRDIPGVSLYGAGGVSSLPAIHGLADDRLRIKVDGMDLIAACPNHMNPALSYIDPTDVESITVYTGISPVSVGGDSIGGAIVVKSEKPRFTQPGEGQKMEAELGGFYRSNGDGMGVNAKAVLANENLSLAYSGAYAKSSNYKAAEDFKAGLYANPANAPFTGRAGHTLALDEVGSSAYETTNQSLDLAWRSGNHLVNAQISHQGIPVENFVNQRMDMTDNQSDKINVGYEGQQGWGSLKVNAYHENTDHAMDFGADKRYWYGTASNSELAPTPAAALNPTDCGVMSPACAHGMPMYTQAKTNGLTVKGELPLAGEDVVRIGGEVQTYSLNDWWTASGAMMWPNTFQNINDGERNRYALFGEWEGKLAERWKGVFGLRHEVVQSDAGDVQGYNSATDGMAPMFHYQMRDSAAFNAADHAKTDHNWDFTVLGRYASDANATYEIGVARKTRSPNLYERYTWSTWQMAALMNNFVGDGNGYVGNLDLKPEVAHTLSVTADWHAADKKAWGLRMTPYYTRVKDYIDAVQWSSMTNTAVAVPVTGAYSVLKYMNQSARLHGVDLSAYTQLAQGTAYGDLSLTGQINWVEGENKDTGDNLYNIMPLNGKLALVQKWGGWTNRLEGVFVSGKDNVSAMRNELATSGYSLFNLRASYEWKQARIDFGVENLFNRAYDLPLGGAYLGQGTTMTLGAAGAIPMWGTAVPGAGRNVYIGGNIKF